MFLLRYIAAIVLLAGRFVHGEAPVSITTTSGKLQGLEHDGVIIFRGIRLAHPPTGQSRWKPPIPFFSDEPQNATAFGPACFQQFAFNDSPELMISIFNDPPQVESEDCLFLNVWAPSAPAKTKRAVVTWIYGGSLDFGTASIAMYDGMSLAQNQDVIVVSFNYRTNVFGFPGAPDIPIQENNLGFFDQELAVAWVQENIEQFGGDKGKVTIMGQSAGGFSVSGLVVRHAEKNPPFRAAIIFSGTVPDKSAVPNFSAFNGFAQAMNCTQAPGVERLDCLRTVSATDIRVFTNGPVSGSFQPLIDNTTTFADNLERIRAGNIAQVALLAGSTQNDGTLFTIGESNLTQFIQRFNTSADFVRGLYPGENDTDVIADAFRDEIFLCPASLWTEAFVDSGIPNVFRYAYGPVFPDRQIFPNAGAWHSTELPEIFGTFNASTATPNEVTFSKTFQTAMANFIKDPNTSPAPNWPKYIPGNRSTTLAKLAYDGNVEMGNFVSAVESDALDVPCGKLWNMFLD
ncbi:hypothetical protein D9757_012298 [Collybiopsis confluens]|uniref:Carboxylic ester hydrolase n=1 Tax=Collybiopsis confluens TaxID=2823264 RepID=A0A8H5G615_9AGAR|nr:hypothetical protein D9757_012298 [Collybiopsis confluens]